MARRAAALNAAASVAAHQTTAEGTVSPATTAESDQPTGWKATFRSLRHRNYRLYFLGQLVSLTGTWVQTTALMWLAYELTKQSKWPALIAATQVLPTFFLGAWGGALADRWPKRRLILITQLILLVLALLLAALVLGSIVTPWHLLAITATSGLVIAVDLPARLAFVVDLVGRDDLINAVALNALMFNLARAAGPALAGSLLTWLGPAACFLLNGLTFTAVLLALARMDVVETARPVEVGRGPLAVLGGFRYLADRPTLLLLILLAGVMALFGWPTLALLPALAEQALGVGGQGYGLLLSGVGAGALLGALMVATFGTLHRRRLLIGLGVTLAAAGLFGLSLAPLLPLAVTCCGLMGFGLILCFATSQAAVQLGASEHNRGRILGIWSMTLSGAQPLGNLLVGTAADRWGTLLVLRVQGLGCIAAALALLALRALWKRRA